MKGTLPFALAVLLSCQPRPQWLVIVDTDARVPQFGDRLQVDILDAQGQVACASCRRQFGVGEEARWPVSFGIPADLPGAAAVRARLYRADHAGESGIAEPVYLDRSGRLPANGEAVTQVRLSLPMDCFFVPGDPARGWTCDPDTRAAGPMRLLPVTDAAGGLLRPDTWRAAREVPCPAAPPDGMVCVPGGVFVLGGPQGLPVGGEFSSLPERLVWLRPFYLDRDEFTVQQARALDPPLALPGVDGTCTGKRPPGSGQDKLPLSCVGPAFAIKACAQLGKRLPTEAEWEYAAGNLRMESRYPWGEESDVCAHAIVGGDPIQGLCQQTRTGPVSVDRQAQDDVTALGIRGMGGNLSELVGGRLQPYSAPCWSPDPDEGAGMLLRNPLCLLGTTSSTPLRGGGWRTGGDEIRVVTRNSMNLLDGAPELGHVDVGFRCAMDVSPAR